MAYNSALGIAALTAWLHGEAFTPPEHAAG
jgi:hypothetical protein